MPSLTDQSATCERYKNSFLSASQIYALKLMIWLAAIAAPTANDLQRYKLFARTILWRLLAIRLTLSSGQTSVAAQLISSPIGLRSTSRDVLVSECRLRICQGI